jgi:hypothetical protein
MLKTELMVLAELVAVEVAGLIVITKEAAEAEAELILKE